MKRIKSNSGETLVEVMVSMVIFILILGMLQKSITFCVNAQKKSEEIRDNNAIIMLELRNAEKTVLDTSTYGFKATTIDGSEVGTKTLFTFDVNLCEQEVSYTDINGNTKSITFAVFAPAGGTPE